MVWGAQCSHFDNCPAQGWVGSCCGQTQSTHGHTGDPAPPRHYRITSHVKQRRSPEPGPTHSHRHRQGGLNNPHTTLQSTSNAAFLPTNSTNQYFNPAFYLDFLRENPWSFVTGLVFDEEIGNRRKAKSVEAGNTFWQFAIFPAFCEAGLLAL